MELKTRNVNTAFRIMIEEIQAGLKGYAGAPPVVRRPSRNGSVLVIDEPVTVTYTHPRERVLFNAARDANPFFHLYESLWMLAGRNDVEPLAYYAKQMEQYSDDGKTLNGAYGYRWRHYLSPDVGRCDHGSTDQLDVLVAHLKADPHSRRAVLQMWNVEDDLLKINSVPRVRCERCIRFGHLTQYDEGRCECYLSGKAASKDVCCNLSVMFSLRDEPDGNRTGTGPERFLDMTVTNRSNDMVWGMLGANYVHFTFLQEYMAARLGAEVGRYHHFSNNLHVYDEPDKAGVPKWKPDEWLADKSGDYPHGFHHWVPLVRDPAVFDREVVEFVDTFPTHQADSSRLEQCLLRGSETFLTEVAGRAMVAYALHKEGHPTDALKTLEACPADDWRIACTNWLQRRAKV